MHTILANGVSSILLPPGKMLTMSVTLGGSVRVVELDAGGRFVTSTTYTLNPTVLGGFATTKIYQLNAVNGTVTYAISERDESLQESRVVAQSGLAVATINDTAEQVLATIPIAAGLLGPNGSLRILTLWSLTNNVNAKTLRVRLGGVSGTIFWAAAGASAASARGYCHIFNRGAQNAQVGGDSASLGFTTSANAVVTGTIDTSVNQDLVISAQKAVGTDTCTLDAHMVEVQPWFI